MRRTLPYPINLPCRSLNLPFTLHLVSSRAKKLKCIKGGESAPCESCTNAGVTCEFRDRDQYFAERSAKSVNAANNTSGSQRPQLSPRARNTFPDYVSSHPTHRGPEPTKRPGSSRSQKSSKTNPSVELCSPHTLSLTMRNPGAPHLSPPSVHRLCIAPGPPFQTTPRRHCSTLTGGRDRTRC